MTTWGKKTGGEENRDSFDFPLQWLPPSPGLTVGPWLGERGTCPPQAGPTAALRPKAIHSPVDYIQFIHHSAHRLREMNALIHTTYEKREASSEAWSQWKQACATFRAHHDPLSFPGGFCSAKSRILAANPDAIEAALTFLELRPYFHRSGYIRNDLFTWLNRLHRENPSAFTKPQLRRLTNCLNIRDEYRARLRANKAAERAHRCRH